MLNSYLHCLQRMLNYVKNRCRACVYTRLSRFKTRDCTKEDERNFAGAVAKRQSRTLRAPCKQTTAYRESPSDGEKTELTISRTSRTPQHNSSNGTLKCRPLASRCSIHLVLEARASSSTSADAFSTPCISCELTYAMKAACCKNEGHSLILKFSRLCHIKFMNSTRL